MPTAIQSDGDLHVPSKVIDPLPTDAHWVNPTTAARVDLMHLLHAI